MDIQSKPLLARVNELKNEDLPFLNTLEKIFAEYGSSIPAKLEEKLRICNSYDDIKKAIEEYSEDNDNDNKKGKKTNTTPRIQTKKAVKVKKPTQTKKVVTTKKPANTKKAVTAKKLIQAKKPVKVKKPTQTKKTVKTKKVTKSKAR
ncbi:MAG: hypothetical protein LBI28_03540 [Treponema sp.]|jgi:hypothetical protein|nr:hypothetical protein [Treponema sp.]